MGLICVAERAILFNKCPDMPLMLYGALFKEDNT